MPHSPINIVLHQPVIPQNTGSIARLCACIGGRLHLIHPLGFDTSDSAVKRAGLDYWDHVDISEHENWEAFVATETPTHLYFFTKFAKASFFDAKYILPAYLVFGSETSGLPDSLHKRYPNKLLKIPMRTELVRSLNLAQAAGIGAFEVIRQNGIPLGE